MHNFEYLEPASLEEAFDLLARYGQDAKIMSGGTALILALRQRLIEAKAIISLQRIRSLKIIRWHGSNLHIGAASRHRDVAHDPNVKEHFPALAYAARHLANQQVRNQGTIGGNLCYGDPTTDPPACLLALDAEVILASRSGIRTLRLDDFFQDYFLTARRDDEIMTAIRLPQSSATHQLYRRHLRTLAEHRPVATLALAVCMNEKRMEAVRVAIGASVPVPLRLSRTEALLEGATLSTELAAEAARSASAEIDAVSDMRGDEMYRRRIVYSMVQSLLIEVLQ